MFSSGIAFYEAAIGSFPGGQDVLIRTNVGDVTSHLVTNLTLTPGGVYYATVWATDYLGMTVSSWCWILGLGLWVALIFSLFNMVAFIFSRRMPIPMPTS